MSEIIVGAFLDDTLDRRVKRIKLPALDFAAFEQGEEEAGEEVGVAVCQLASLQLPEQLLGRAKEAGVPVHRLAAERLALPGSQFNNRRSI